MKDILLSVILPVYNGEAYLKKCVESILQGITDPEEIELLLVDDGSEDGTGALADGYAEENPCVRAIHRKNGGTAAARNTGLKAACGEYLYFVDGDDWLAPNGIQLITGRIRQYREAQLILFDACQNREEEETGWEHFPRERRITEQKEIRALQRKVLYSKGIPLSACWDRVYRKDFLKRHGICFREQLMVLDDMVFNVEVFGCLERAVYCKDKIYHYRYVASSITHSSRTDREAQNQRVWSYLERYIREYIEQKELSGRDSSLLWQAYYCRLVKSFAILCKRGLFPEPDQDGEMSVREKAALRCQQIYRVKGLLSEGSYREAALRVRLRYLEGRLKAAALLMRFRLGFGMYLLYWGDKMTAKWQDAGYGMAGIYQK